jgi:hypothetical protein
MSRQNPSSNLEPIRIRDYPPFALAMGMSFLTWLMGSLAYDSLLGKNKDIVLGIIFGLVFLAAVAIALNSWISLLAIRRIGLYMNESGVTEVQAGLLGTRTRTRAWEDVTEIKMDKGVLIFETRKKKAKENEKKENSEPMRVMTAGLLENPEWMLERANAWAEAVKNNNKEDKTVRQLSELEAEFEGVVCRSCGGSVDIRLGAVEEAVCRHCGSTQTLSDKVKEALKRFSAVIKDLPAAHRQFREDTLRRFVEHGKKHRRVLLGVGWGTAGVWVLFALVGFISDLAEKESKGIDFLSLGVFAGLAVLSVVTAYLLAYFIRRVSGTYSLPMQALAPVKTGGAARCRLCGAGLPEKGIIRRCVYCGTDSVVVGDRLAEAERMTREAIQQAQDSVRRSTETAARLLDSAAFKMQIFDYGQFFWLHIPIVVALDGSTGMLVRVTGIFLAMLAGNLASTVLGLRWLNR